MPIKKSAPITLLTLDRKNHAIRRKIDLLLRAAEEKMALVRSDPWKEWLSYLISQLKSVKSVAYFTDREDSPYKEPLTSIENIQFKYYQDAIFIILDRLLSLLSDAIAFFEKEGVATPETVTSKQVSWLTWKAGLERQVELFATLNANARHFILSQDNGSIDL